MKKYAMMVLGCKVNDYEAHYLKEQLDKDYTEVKFNEEADIYIVFSCCVTNIAESKTRKFIHRIKKEHPNAYTVVIGCYVQSKHDDEVFKDVDLLVGSSHKDKIKEYIDKMVKADLYEKDITPKFEELFMADYKGKTRSFLKIQDGCDQYCAYCIIPYARGHERSGDFYKLIDQAKRLAEHSKEIVLTGIHTGRYHDGDHDLAELISELSKINDLETIRLSSIEITEINDKIIKEMKGGKLAHHLHIPVQAGSDDILKAMYRPYTIKEFLDKIEDIRKEIPDILISTDLIVGFPGETDELFARTIDFIKEANLSFIHCFPYAKKDGTKASLSKDQIPGDIKKARAQKVAEVQKDITEKIWSSYIGKKVTVLTEVYKDGFTSGHSKEYLPISIMAKIDSGKMVNVKIINTKSGRMIGEVSEDVVE